MLKDQIYQDIITAMKAGEKMKTEALKMIKAEIMKHEVSAADAEATDEVVTKILQRAVKQRKEAAEGFDQGGNSEAAQKERQEAEVYQGYLPEQMDAESIKKIVQETVQAVAASGPSDMGKVMGAIMPKVQGKADGKLVKDLVMEHLQNL